MGSAMSRAKSLGPHIRRGRRASCKSAFDRNSMTSASSTSRRLDPEDEDDDDNDSDDRSADGADPRDNGDHKIDVASSSGDGDLQRPLIM